MNSDQPDVCVPIFSQIKFSVIFLKIDFFGHMMHQLYLEFFQNQESASRSVVRTTLSSGVIVEKRAKPNPK